MLKAFLVGNLARDPEVRFTSEGTAIVKAAVAVNRSYEKDGKKVEEVDFWDIDLFDKRGEAFAKYHKKGDKVIISGRMQQSKWTHKESGEPRSKPVLIVEEWEFASGRKSDAAPTPAQ